jgi:hypothetical protein
MRRFALVTHPSHNPWRSKENNMQDNQFTPTDVELAEEMLTELLYLAITANDRLRPAWISLADGVSNMVSNDAFERSKEYAAYRAHHNHRQ